MNVIETIKGQMAESARVKQRMLEDDALVEKIEDIAGAGTRPCGPGMVAALPMRSIWPESW